MATTLEQRKELVGLWADIAETAARKHPHPWPTVMEKTANTIRELCTEIDELQREKEQDNGQD
jgi:hypothetical protein